MRRLARHAFTSLAALSLLLCVAVCVAWVRSCSHKERIIHSRTEHAHKRGRIWHGGYDRGIFDVGCTYYKWIPGEAALRAGRQDHGKWGYGFSPQRVQRLAVRRNAWQYGEFRYDDASIGTDIRGWRLCVPCWFVVLCTLVLPARWTFVQLRQHRRRNSGLCPKCGYDLRASPSRCPECGANSARAAVSLGVPDDCE